MIELVSQMLKNALRKIPFAVPAVRFARFRSETLAKALRFRSVTDTFDDYYKTGYWGRYGNESGHGSDMIQTETIRRELPILFKELKIRTLLDIPCGDFFWMKEMPLGNIEYLGGDIVDDLIRANDKFTTDEIQFKRLNLIESPLPEMDLIFVRDCLVHLTNKDITRSLQNICDSNSRYLLTTLFSDCGRNLNIVTGQWRELNLTLEPFNLPEPIKLINENHIHDRHKDKCLALWEVSVIRKALS